MSRAPGRHDVYTTQEAATLCRVSVPTVKKWFDAGLIQGFRIPPHNHHRRIFRASLETFMRTHGLPPARLSPAGRRIEIEGAIETESP